MKNNNNFPDKCYKITGPEMKIYGNSKKFEIGLMKSDVATYFTTIQNIFYYCNNGPILISAKLDQKSTQYNPEKMVKDGPEIPGYASKKFLVEEIVPFWDYFVIENLILNGADPTIEDYWVFQVIYIHHHQLWKQMKVHYDNIISRVPEKYLTNWWDPNTSWTKVIDRLDWRGYCV